MILEKTTTTQTQSSGLKIGRPVIPLAMHLALKEVWRNRGRFLLVSLVIALITTLVLFIAGLAEGLGLGNKEYIEKLNAELLLYQKNVDLSIPSSRFDRSMLTSTRRVEGVEDVGSIAFSNGSILLAESEPLKVSLIGIEPGQPGEPPAFEGRGLQSKRDRETIIDKHVALRTGLKVGDTLTFKTVQGVDEELYPLKVVGISDGRQYSIQPSVFVPYVTWEDVRPKSTAEVNQSDLLFNLVAIQVENPQETEAIAHQLENQIGGVEVVDRKTAYEATPGYSAQQSTLNTQRVFTLVIGVLVIGGFFQIQTLQKVAQVGMLKAIGVSNFTVVIASLVQIVIVTLLGVAIGGIGTLLLGLSFPPTVPIVFTPQAVIVTILSLLFIGPLGGLVSLRLLLKVEPLTALGLSS